MIKAKSAKSDATSPHLKGAYKGMLALGVIGGMMKDMGDSMDGMKMEDSHYIALTISDDTAKTVVKGAKVFIEIEGPNDSSQKKMAMVMEGKGMYHYSAGCDLTAKGMYNVKARFIIDGASLEAKVMYTTD